MTPLDPQHPNPIESKSDRELVRDATNTNPYPVLEMTRRLIDAIRAQEQSSAALGRRIEKLNVWLLRATIAIGLMTLVQVAAALVQAYAAWRGLR